MFLLKLLLLLSASMHRNYKSLVCLRSESWSEFHILFCKDNSSILESVYIFYDVCKAIVQKLPKQQNP